MDSHRSSESPYGSQFLLNLFPQTLSTVLEASGLVRGSSSSSLLVHTSSSSSDRAAEEVSIRIIGDEEQIGTDDPPSTSGLHIPSGELGSSPPASPRFSDTEEVENGQTEDANNAREANNTQRYDFQPLARYVEQVLPFTILLLLVFIRQHLQGLAVTFWITAIMIKSNDLVRKQTALKGERKKTVILSVAAVLILHVVGVYWWYKAEAIWRPLILLPPRKIPKFWQAVFMIMVNDVMVRQVGMAIKCFLLLSYKSTRGRHYRRQGQLLTVVEYLMLLFRVLIPGPVWYRFFLNKEYGNLFSSLITGLYLTFKLTSVIEKVKTFIAAVRLMCRSEVLYGVHATIDEVLGAGDMCAICQEKMHSPISLRCKHIFCEDCVSEWFERERTCPLCRAVVKSTDFRSFADGSTSLLMQFF